MSDAPVNLVKLLRDGLPALRAWIESTRALNTTFVTAWNAGYLDALWEQMRVEYPTLWLTYFIRLRGTGDIKIGKSNHVGQRVDSLYTAASRGLDLVACYPAPKVHELELHRDFNRYRLNGEWFRAGGNIVAFLSLIGVDLQTFSDEPPPRSWRGQRIPRFSHQGAFEQGDNHGLSARAADDSAEPIADREGAGSRPALSVAPSAGDTGRGADSDRSVAGAGTLRTATSGAAADGAPAPIADQADAAPRGVVTNPVAASGADVGASANSESESRRISTSDAIDRKPPEAEAGGTDGSRPPSHQCVSDGVSTGHPEAGNAPAGVASGVSPAPLTDDRGFMVDGLPAFLDQRSAA